MPEMRLNEQLQAQSGSSFRSDSDGCISWRASHRDRIRYASPAVKVRFALAFQQHATEQAAKMSGGRGYRRYTGVCLASVRLMSTETETVLERRCKLLAAEAFDVRSSATAISDSTSTASAVCRAAAGISCSHCVARHRSPTCSPTLSRTRYRTVFASRCDSWRFLVGVITLLFSVWDRTQCTRDSNYSIQYNTITVIVSSHT